MVPGAHATDTQNLASRPKKFQTMARSSSSRREVPDRGDVGRCLERVGREEVVVFEEVAAARAKNITEKTIRKTTTPTMSLHRVVRMEGDAVAGKCRSRPCSP